MVPIEILDATVEVLRRELDLEEHECGIQMNGVPPPSGVERYVAVDEASTSSDGADFLRERLGVDVYVMVRAGEIPAPRGNGYRERLRMLEPLGRGAIAALHSWQGVNDVRNTANDLMQAGTANTGDVIQLPLLYQGAAKIDTTSPDTSETLYVRRRLTFAAMVRIQNLCIIK